MFCLQRFNPLATTANVDVTTTTANANPDNAAGTVHAVIAAVLALALFFSLLWSPAPATANSFSDTRGHWAEQSILEMSAYDVVHGYPEGIFKPNADIAFQETIVMIINALGWRDKAAAADTTGLIFPAETWAKEYLALAVEKGMLTKAGLSALNPKQPATRLEVAFLLCLALNLQPDNSLLSFQDAEQIKPNYRGYVGAIVGKGIMVGLPGNIFAPEMKITRAQMCAMLFRLIEQNLIAPPPSRQRLIGRITEIDGEEKTVTVRNLSGEKTIAVSDDCPLYKGKELIMLDSLAKNSRVKLIADNERIYYGLLLNDFGPAQKIVEGFVNSFTPAGAGREAALILENETGEKQRYELYPDARIVDGSRELTEGDFKQDIFLRAELDVDNKIFDGKKFSPEKASGILMNLDRNELAIKSRGIKENYQISKNVRMTRNTLRPLSFSELAPGDYVSLTVLGGKVFYLDCLSGVVTGLSGIISKVRKESIYIYVGKEEKHYDLDEQIEVCQDGRRKDLDDLKRGDYVNFFVANNQKVFSVELIDEQEGEFTGAVLYLGAGNRPFLTLRTTGGLELDYDLNSNVAVLRNGDEINLEDIVPGAQVLITVEEGEVEKIEVLDDRNITVEGRLVKINVDKSRLTMEINGRNYNYDLAQGAEIFDAAGKKTNLKDLLDYWVKAKLVAGVIQKIEARN